MSSNPKNNLLTIHMRKTKKRVTAATKLQALARGKHVRSQQKRQNNASDCHGRNAPLACHWSRRTAHK